MRTVKTMAKKQEKERRADFETILQFINQQQIKAKQQNADHRADGGEGVGAARIIIVAPAADDGSYRHGHAHIEHLSSWVNEKSRKQNSKSMF